MLVFPTLFVFFEIKGQALAYNLQESNYLFGWWVMKRSVSLWQLWGFAVTALGGTLLHFLYDWTNKSLIVAPFSGVNESTWEHIKLLFWPMFLFAIVQYFFFKDRDNFWSIKLFGTLVGMILIPILFYTYNGVIGRSPDWINITIFFVAAAVAYITETYLFKRDPAWNRGKLSFFVLVLIALLFLVFTFYTPEIALFKDPVDGTYGVTVSE